MDVDKNDVILIITDYVNNCKKYCILNITHLKKIINQNHSNKNINNRDKKLLNLVLIISRVKWSISLLKFELGRQCIHEQK